MSHQKESVISAEPTRSYTLIEVEAPLQNIGKTQVMTFNFESTMKFELQTLIITNVIKTALI